MEIKEIAVSQLHPYENNPRNNAESVDKVANSIKEFGFKVPIVIDRNFEIVAGHTRYLAAQQLGLETVPCIIADDLTPKQVQAFRLADNKVAELSGWDYSKLQKELDELGDQFDMSSFGFLDSQDVDFDKFLTDTENPEKQDKGPETITCPECGHVFEK